MLRSPGMLPRQKPFVAARRLAILTSAAAFTLVLGCRQSESFLTRLDDARALAADLRVQFNKSTDASNRAVMADTDEASIGFAKESEQATQVVETDMKALAPLLGTLGFATEISAFGDFKTRFAAYHELDRSILTLAVENTNLKAQSLSFGPARQAADAFRDAVVALAASFSPKDRCQVTELSAEAVTAVREIQVLYAPHIAERDDAAMSKMEQEMAARDARAREALKKLDELAPPNARASLTAAHEGLDKLKTISDQIVALSRRNTNVLSLDLSLRKKPALALACDERLGALQVALAGEGSKATR